jgi:hypothetical protein
MVRKEYCWLDSMYLICVVGIIQTGAMIEYIYYPPVQFQTNNFVVAVIFQPVAATILQTLCFLKFSRSEQLVQC